MLDPMQIGATEIADGVNRGQYKAVDIAQLYLQRTDDLHRNYNSHILWNKSEASADVERQLASLDDARRAGRPLPLAGVPIAIKDNIMVEGQLTTCGSQFLRNHRAAYDATVIKKLRAAGAIILGRANMDEFGMGSSNENSSFGPVKNPWQQEYVAGGSSGGSAAIVAAGLSPLALGSDTGGSIRLPASFCGVYGLKPSYGAVSRYGLIAYASSLDQIGPLARNPRDLARVYDVIEGYDSLDSTSHLRSRERSLEASLEGDLRGLTIGVIDELMDEGLDPEVRKAFDESLESMKSLGASIKHLRLPSLRLGIPVYYIIATAEASSNLARFDGIRFGARSSKAGASLKELYFHSRSEGFGREVKQRIMLGSYVLSSGYYDAYYAKACRLREAIKRELQEAFASGVDCIATPTAPTTAFALGQKTHDSLSMYLMDIYTIVANLAGIPALSLPIGLDRKGLPIGLQLMAPASGEDLLLRSAYHYEKQHNWSGKQRPRI